MFQFVLGLLFSTYGIVVYVLIPQAMIDQHIGLATWLLLLLRLSCTIGTILIVRYGIHPLSIYLLETYYFLNFYLCCSRKGRQRKSIVYKNLESNRERNMSMGITILGILCFMMQIQYLQDNLKACINVSIARVAAGDFFIMMTADISSELDG